MIIRWGYKEIMMMPEPERREYLKLARDYVDEIERESKKGKI